MEGTSKRRCEEEGGMSIETPMHMSLEVKLKVPKEEDQDH